MQHIIDEFIGYVWQKSKQEYVQVGASLSNSFEECKQFFEDYNKQKRLVNRLDYDFSNYFIKMRRITYTGWEIIYE